MSWTKLEKQNQAIPELTSKSELDSLRSIVVRCLSDITVSGLSDEQRFIIAYDAARNLSLMLVRAEGYRPGRAGGHHSNVFEGLAAVNATFTKAAAYFQICRQKRNVAEYDYSGGITEHDADELVKFVTHFEADVEAWISKHHPKFAK